MDAIKKKMTTMKNEKEAAYTKAAQLEQKVAEQKALNERQEGEMQSLQKTISQLEGETGRGSDGRHRSDDKT